MKKKVDNARPLRYRWEVRDNNNKPNEHKMKRPPAINLLPPSMEPKTVKQETACACKKEFYEKATIWVDMKRLGYEEPEAGYECKHCGSTVDEYTYEGL